MLICFYWKTSSQIHFSCGWSKISTLKEKSNWYKDHGMYHLMMLVHTRLHGRWIHLCEHYLERVHSFPKILVNLHRICMRCLLMQLILKCLTSWTKLYKMTILQIKKTLKMRCNQYSRIPNSLKNSEFTGRRHAGVRCSSHKKVHRRWYNNLYAPD